NPSPGQRKVMEGIIEYSDRLVVMSQRAVKMLQNVFQIPEEMIRVIPHGIHDMPFGDPAFFKDQFGVERNKVILTFGLLGPSKGLENMIDAMPKIVEKHPDAVYLILGASRSCNLS
ncbi:MAG: glycosyl transferase family 1, partial [Candidatus Bathyarchaeia archaeon]